jgi:UDP-N-acetylmuramyl pentapeptide phosphotransferase/UDP-N-acetylglucosamine-1-phosphate transferase
MGKTLGIIMIIVGAAMLIWTGFSFTKKEKVVDIGPVEISADKKEHVNWPPYVGGIVLVAGIVVVATSKKN